MPFTGELQIHPGTADNPDSGYRSRFSHDTEISRPGYYEVLLTDDQIKVQLTATERTGIHKYTYPADQKKQLILDLNHGIYNTMARCYGQTSGRKRHFGLRATALPTDGVA